MHIYIYTYYIYIYILHIYTYYIYIHQLMENFGSWKMAWPNEKGPSDFACAIGDEKRAWTKPPAKRGYGVSASMLTLGDINPLVLLVNMIQHQCGSKPVACSLVNPKIARKWTFWYKRFWFIPIEAEVNLLGALFLSRRITAPLPEIRDIRWLEAVVPQGGCFFFGTLRARQLPAGYLVVQCAHLEKWWSSSMGRMTSNIPYMKMENKKCLKPPTSYISLGLPVVTINGP